MVAMKLPGCGATSGQPELVNGDSSPISFASDMEAIMSKANSITKITAVFAAALSLSTAALAADTATPVAAPAAKVAAPAAAETAKPADVAKPVDAAAGSAAKAVTPPVAKADAAPAAAPSDAKSADTKSAAEPAAKPPAKPMGAPVAPAAAPQKSAAAPAAVQNLKATEFALGASVMGADGKQIGKINRISSSANGTVSEIYVDTGKAGGVVIVPANAIAAGGANVKLSLTADEAAKLPAVGGGNG